MNKKFTLIEILVVVTVIGILVSLLAPSLASARDKSRAALCKSNLRQIGNAQYFYADDNEGNLTLNAGGDWWPEAMYNHEYLPINEDVMTCPSFPYPGDWLNDWNHNKYQMTYGGSMDRKWDPREGVTFIQDDGIKGIYIKPSEVNSSSDFYLFADSVKVDNNGSSPTNGQLVQRFTFYWDDRDGANCKGIHIRHNNKGNVWFVDGHVEAAGVGRLTELDHDAVTLEDGVTVVPLN
ncbi:prepilin-type N-terminal cleavage/methylation domain-containing protein [Lentisphaera marina]|uniref:prepilin-type N-terminal cleavage/methylation domain-containing protein n=1 Tax=Lentisphaera marina TaxID=1111041 RepID=UPI002366EB16|nr:H-X9-DG-CTERM domain-containing protein [Lentisphaera marina]MDD7985022.1 prepilin-type N-terminal cleavage/methylation domain-containing protein [Lentisphaera marina]